MASTKRGNDVGDVIRGASMNYVLGLRPGTDADSFVSYYPPLPMREGVPLSYGGFALSLSMNAALQTVEDAAYFHPYSVLGNYLGPTTGNVDLELKVTRLRDTRTFKTRQVTAFQTIKGAKRACMTLTLDCVRRSAGSADDKDGGRDKELPDVVSLDVQPDPHPEHHSNLKMLHDQLDEDVKMGLLPAKPRKLHAMLFGEATHCIDLKHPRHGFNYQTIEGFFPKAKTTQDHLSIPQRVVMDWFHAKEPPEAKKSTKPHSEGMLLPPTLQTASACFLLFAMDAFLPITPLVLSRTALPKAQAHALDFSLRFHMDEELDAQGSWFYREIKTLTAKGHRSFNTARVWQERGDGSLALAATMSQSCLLRPLPPPAKPSSKM